MSEDRSRQQRHEEIQRLRAGGAAGESLPAPPYHLRDISLLFLQCRFDHDTIAPIVPPGLVIAKSGWGSILNYTVGAGWGLAPYTGFLMTVELEGLDSPDGQPGFYMHSGWYSGVGGKVMSTIYNANVRPGWSRLQTEGTSVAFENGVEDADLVRIRVQRTGGPPTPQNGVSHYIGRRPGGGFNSYSVAWSMDFQPVEVESLEFLPGAERFLNLVRPLEFTWTVWAEGASMAFTPPVPLGAPKQAVAEATQTVGVVRLFSRLGRAAAIVDAEGGLVTLNEQAELLVARGAIVATGGRLAPYRHSDSAVFQQLLASAGPDRPDPVSNRIALGIDGGSSIIAQAVQLDPGVAGPGKLVVFFDDPARDDAIDAGPALQLLGLTPAESRVASLVGAGRSPREAADQLELTVNTVRSALKIAFDKLGISRQSELAKIVARLAG